jgi:hypothetical protein
VVHKHATILENIAAVITTYHRYNSATVLSLAHHRVNHKMLLVLHQRNRLNHKGRR